MKLRLQNSNELILLQLKGLIEKNKKGILIFANL